MARADPARAGLIVRCAIYTRKSSDEGLEQEFNSLDAQREACEAYIVSQRHAGWVALADMYDDGGLSGGTMERPALKRLLEDITASKVQTEGPQTFRAMACDAARRGKKPCPGNSRSDHRCGRSDRNPAEPAKAHGRSWQRRSKVRWTRTHSRRWPEPCRCRFRRASTRPLRSRRSIRAGTK